VDTLSEVLDNLRSSGALVGRSLLAAPWRLRLRTTGTITLVTMLRGDGWLLREGQDPLPLTPGDVAIVTDAGWIDLADSRATPPECTCLVIADGRCADAAGRPVDSADTGLDGRTGPERLEGEHALLTGAFPTSGRIADRLLGALPPVLLVPRSSRTEAALELIEEEIGGCEPGQQAMLDRLLDLVLLRVLREAFAAPGATVPGWYQAVGDVVVGPALAALHADPARDWTVASLAAEAGVARATFARRFAELMGEPPISYLAGWRLCQAADLLVESESTLETIARTVGYGSSYALSAAFTREYGMRPTAYRSRSHETGETSVVSDTSDTSVVSAERRGRS